MRLKNSNGQTIEPSFFYVTAPRRLDELIVLSSSHQESILSMAQSLPIMIFASSLRSDVPIFYRHRQNVLRKIIKIVENSIVDTHYFKAVRHPAL
jgi:hypothetical protein